MSIRPPLLGPGSRVALVAPAGPLSDESELNRALENARSLGWRPEPARSVLARHGYLAGPDEARASDFNRAITSDEIDGIWCVRGGYGVMRILPAMDFDALRARPKAIIGFSDITALHGAIRAKSGIVSFHGPTGRGVLTDFSRRSLEAAVIHGSEPCGVSPAGVTLVAGKASGELAGGNLALLASLAGTPYFPDLRGAILVLEDVNEPVYRIDRMLHQLRLSGLLNGLAGLIFGSFTERGSEEDSDSIESLMAETAAALGVPCMSGAPLGHIPDQWTLPLGTRAEFDADARRLTICWDG